MKNKRFSMAYLKMIMINLSKFGYFKIEKQKIKCFQQHSWRLSLPKFRYFKIFISTKCFQWHTWRRSCLKLSKLVYFKIEKRKIKGFQWYTWWWSWLNLSKLGYFRIEKVFSMTYLKMSMIESFKIRIF